MGERLIWQSIQNGPTPHPMVTDPPPTGSNIVPAPRKKLDSEFNDEENKLEMADTQAEIILSQGPFPRPIFKHPQSDKHVLGGFEQCRKLLQGTREGKKEENRNSKHTEGRKDLFDVLTNAFRLPIWNESIMTTFLLGGKYVTKCQTEHGYSPQTYVQIIFISKPTSLMPKRLSSNMEQLQLLSDPLAYACLTPHPGPAALSSTITPSPFQPIAPGLRNLRTSSNSRTHATVHDGHIVTEPVQRKAPCNVGNTGARGKKVICYNCRGEGHVARQCKEPKRKMDSRYFKDKALLMEGKEERRVLDAEAEAIPR
ncbi:retrovirus-related pol polyprotein from transposon TNT 1-94 [Tanacetum coccineum]